jgi:CTP:molybdopterin cytidylyltransferase MocA
VKNTKAKVATGATVVLLAGLGGLAMSQGSKAPLNTVADKPLVRTKVIRRTIHVTKHAKPKHPVAAAPVEPEETAPVVTGSSGSSENAPVSTGSSGASEPASVTTNSSGTGTEAAPVDTGSCGGAGEAEHESEGVDD